MSPKISCSNFMIDFNVNRNNECYQRNKRKQRIEENKNVENNRNKIYKF